MSAPLCVATLSSGRGRGTNLQAILDACAEGRIPARVVLTLSTTPDAPALQRAAAAGAEAIFIDPSQEAGDLDERLLAAAAARGVELVCLTGYLRLLGSPFLDRFPMRIMNIHPALLPAFGGKGFYGRRVHEAVIESGARFSGATVHFVDPEYDHGPIILQSVVPVLDDDTAETLAARILIEEHRLYPEAISLFAQCRLQVRGPEGSDSADKLIEVMLAAWVTETPAPARSSDQWGTADFVPATLFESLRPARGPVGVARRLDSRCQETDSPIAGLACAGQHQA